MFDTEKYSKDSFCPEVLSALDTDQFSKTLAQAANYADDNVTPAILSVTIPFDKIDPLAVLELLSPADTLQYYWEHPEDKTALSAGGSVHHIQADGEGRFMAVSEAIESCKSRIFEFTTLQHSLSGVHFLGGFSFFDQIKSEEWKAFDGAHFIIPEWSFIVDGELALLTLNQKLSPESNQDSTAADLARKLSDIANILQQLRRKPAEVIRSASLDVITPNGNSAERENWLKTITTAKEHIHSGEINKIVISRKEEIKVPRDRRHTQIVNRLRKQYPSCYSFLFSPDGKTTFAGSSPERLISVRQNYILTEGLAGSISRGETATDDAILEKELLNSRKDLEEHKYVVNSVVKRLQRFSDEVNYPERPGIKKFTNVQHLYTPVSAWLNSRHDPFKIIRSLHPTPAVGGTPSERALDLIPRYESHDRGWYAGPVGWFNTKGRGEFAVAIRSGLLHDGTAHLFAGCGIVEDSNPAKEWDETKLKLIPMISAINYD